VICGTDCIRRSHDVVDASECGAARRLRSPWLRHDAGDASTIAVGMSRVRAVAARTSTT